MLLAIDVGNTRTKVGHWDGENWARLESVESSPQQIRTLLSTHKATAAICASVVPSLNDDVIGALSPLAMLFLTPTEDWHGFKVGYEPPTSLGADRFANALGVLAHTDWDGGIAVDFGTATKIDVIGDNEEDDAAYLGGCIMPGVEMGAMALSSGTSLLPRIDLSAPSDIIGNSTLESLRSGVVLAHACAVDEWIRRVREEDIGDEFVFVTGGLADLMAPLCRTKMIRKPYLTLDGLVEAAKRLSLT